MTTQLQSAPVGTTVAPVAEPTAAPARRRTSRLRNEVDPNEAILTFLVAGGVALSGTWLALTTAIPDVSSMVVWAAAGGVGFVVGSIGAWKNLSR